MSINAIKVEEAIRPQIESLGAYLVELSIRGERTGRVVEVFIDTDTGVDADTCARISREISPTLDGLEELQGKYNLVVSSPGIDRPLKFLKQYERNIGRTISIKLKEGDGKQKIEGTLSAVSPAVIQITTKGGESKEYPFADIAEAFIVPRW